MGLDRGTITMVIGFVYNSEHHVVVCIACKACVVPTARGVYRHLRREPHALGGVELRATAEALLSHKLRALEELRI
jgi:hypothetical protein